MVIPVSRATSDKLLLSKCFMTIKDVAERAQLSERTVHRLIAKKQLKSVRIGRTIRIHPDDFEAMVMAAKDHE